ncbi:MAG TPA: phage head closure protein [Terriglobales bacterium]|nr:phage head closure protein [Terriglobales bacterium]
MSLPKKLSTGFRYLGASAYNSKITLMNPEGIGSSGSKVAPTVFKADVPANITVLRGKEQLRGPELTATMSYKIVIRYRAGVNSAMTVVNRDQTFRIEDIGDPDGQRVELHLLCSLVNDGR